MEAPFMQPCACGVEHYDNSGTCPITISQPLMQQVPSELPFDQLTAEREVLEVGGRKELSPATARPQTSTLIEFPGVSRTVPEWRKQLSQRVREVQERKAREAAEAAALAQED